MTKKHLANLVAIAACNFELPVTGGNTRVIQVTPAGYFSALDGRPGNGLQWFIDAAIANRTIEKFNARKSELVIDYDHQTLRKEENGQEAPAAAWYKSLQWREGDGLYATVELTARAQEKIDAKPPEFRYFSPVFSYNKKTGAVDEILMGAITNTPAIDELSELTQLAAASYQFTTEDNDMTLLAALIAALGLAENTTEEQAVAALNSRLTADPSKPIRIALGVGEDASTEVIVAACNSLKLKAEKAGNPDPANYVPVAVVTDLQKQIAILNNRFAERDAGDLETTISNAIKTGKLIGKPMEDWARDLGKKDIAALNYYLDSATGVAALSQSQTGNKPRVDESTGLDETEVAMCNQMGLTAEEFLAAKKQS